MTAVLSRADSAPEYQWNVASIFSDDAAWQAAFEAVREALPTLTAYRGRLGEAVATLVAFLQLRDETTETAERVLTYARMRKDEDNGNTTYQAMEDRAMSLATELGGALAFFEPELLALPPETLQQWQQQTPALAVYKHQFEQVLRGRDHVRSAEVEELLSQSFDLARVPDNTYTLLTNADLEFPSIPGPDGEQLPVTQSRYGQLRQSLDREVRRAAFASVHGAYHKFRNTMGATLGGAIRANLFYARAQRHPSALAAALFPNNVPESVYRSLLSTVEANLHLLHRYVLLRKRLLKVDELHHYDLYVPLVGEVDAKFPYGEALQSVIAALAPLGEQYQRDLQAGVARGWIDVYENVGKTSGAYSGGSYKTEPFVLLNYQDTLDSVFTLAHELGHSMHSFYTRQNQPYQYGDYSIFLAEVASTLNEELLSHHLIANAEDDKLKAYLVNQQLESIRTTLFRQAMFADFELQLHERAEAGEGMTPELFSGLYQKLNERYYGSEIVDHEAIAIEWSRIPHFYWSFYVYQYATGISAATALARSIMAGETGARERYLRFLAAGSSDYPIELLRQAGVDMTTPEPVQRTMAAFEQRLDEMERICQQTGLL